MANKSYLDMAGLTKYDELIKGVIGTEADAAETNAKDYADGLKSTIDGEIDAVEAAATALTTRVTNLETTVNTDHETRLDTLEGAATLEGSVKYQVKQASDAINATIGTVPADSTVMAEIEKARISSLYDDTQVKADIAANTKAITDEIARAKGAEQTNATAIANEVTRAKEVEAGLNAYMGDIPETATSENLVDYISEVVTANAYNDTQVKADIKANADAIDAIEADYLKGADKTELQGNIDKKVEQSAYDTKVAELVAEDTRIAGLVSTEATARQEADEALAAKIGDVAEGTNLADMIEAHKTAIDGTVTTLVGEDTGKSVRTIANEELAAQLLSGNADADFKTLQELAAWLENHPESVAEINLNIENLQKLVGTIPEGATSTDIVNYIAEVVAGEKSRAEGVESGLDTRLKAVETALGTGEGSVEDKIATAKQEAIDASKEYADSLADDYATAEQGAKADTALQASDITTGTENGTIAVKGTDVAVKGLGSAAYAKVEDFDAAGTAATKASETLTSANDYTDTEIAKFVAITDDEINGLFA